MHKRMPPHGDFDHLGEAVNLVNNFNVENVIFNCMNIQFRNSFNVLNYQILMMMIQRQLTNRV